MAAESSVPHIDINPFAIPGEPVEDVIARRRRLHPRAARLEDQLNAVTEQRDELLAALKYIIGWQPGLDKWNAETARNMARAAIIKAKGQ